MTEKIYSFDVPVSGRETFSVIASSYEEALEKIYQGQYHIQPEVGEIEWDFGLGQDSENHLPECFVVSDLEENDYDNSN
ncbi:hypothetical protein [Acinetobacter bereziniae]|uniref:hypothetical protein n=1 Tax=Acinetobacter bereziniae TaxID=106648 RepID=UPI0015DA7F5D|nr:hypothetical protein [Acinetobacter bereziniae]